MREEENMTAGDSPCLTPSPEVAFTDVEGETVLLNLQTERYYGLDEVGTRFWQLLTEHERVEAVVPLMLAEFDVDEATLRQDLTSLISELTEAGLLTVSVA